MTSVSLPRYVATQLGELPDAYLVDGARTTPLSLIEEPMGGLSAVAAPQLPDDFAAISEIANTVANVSRVHADVTGLSIADARVVALEAPSQRILDLHRRALSARKASAS